MSDTPLRERLAALAHEQWAGWTRWMIDQWSPDAVARWERQIATPYDDLSEREKNSDRVEADKVIACLSAEAAASAESVGMQKLKARCSGMALADKDAVIRCIDVLELLSAEAAAQNAVGPETRRVIAEWAGYCLTGQTANMLGELQKALAADGVDLQAATPPEGD